ncbi:RNA-protein complex protein Nop10 [Methermicoccus shengliensis]|uniref:Ribosome biogenesis protein Nop10 n=1 Tax=Methermicoccus shengliensis TaxID=660064 RepID=A0A832VWN8_9EURY|nr:RNA-protein complex protein Nop10 [Methermicoccus shengliensis]KUK04399.1 MAG: Ribosome biogenesis protein Nop10 [Euryarchaeota archaeon 55_53]KUK30210.1 MAG: Ribosome biogenesis protein Nop10 [Methanosarcinales archeaon 56_1174]MDI3488574.1 ribonucleoprotein complex subunit 3 [Methanosarcinales archaeon]MDN5295770.1 ribonucleoprotein complex subunit 3 [Methanosarcinales archaeon]HIH69048.1 RNA-protein complex protein Nop10 [Methermicoccus shengliensis]
MRSKILRCPACGRYTLKEMCPVCGTATASSRPARFSPQDRYGRYRRMLLKEAHSREL